MLLKAGELEFGQEDLKQKGHAIECRIYAEDPDNNFMPSAGKVYKISGSAWIGCSYRWIRVRRL